MTKIQKSKHGLMRNFFLKTAVLVIEYWILRFICYLVLVIWDLSVFHHQLILCQ